MESAKATARKLKEVIRPDESILDVGCGVGHYLPSLKRLLDVPFRYTGIDSTECYKMNESGGVLCFYDSNEDPLE